MEKENGNYNLIRFRDIEDLGFKVEGARFLKQI